MTNNDELARNPVLTYADSYRCMAKQGAESVPVWGVITDLERNIAPLYAALLAERDADKKQLESWRSLAKQNIAEHEKAVIALDAARLRIRELETVSAAAEKLVRCKGRYHSEQNYRALAALFGVSTPDLPPLDTEARKLDVIVPPRRCFDYAALAVQERDEQWHKALHDACKRGGIKLEVGE